MQKDRWFSLVTYTDENIVNKVIERYGQYIRNWAYIVHDKDDVGYHIHMIIRTHQSYTFKAISNWFRAVQSDEDMRNTFVQRIIDRQGIVDYLTHKYESKEKFKYNEDDIKGDYRSFIEQDSKDDSYEILLAVMNRVPYRDIVKLYGRDFIFHFDAYYKLACAIYEQEGTPDKSRKATDTDPKAILGFGCVDTPVSKEAREWENYYERTEENLLKGCPSPEETVYDQK